MADLGELRQPDIEISQEFQTSSPNRIVPTLLSCTPGVCRQVVEVLTAVSGGQELNADSKTSTPAFIIVAGTTFTTLNGLNLGISVNNSPVVSVAFTGTSLSNQQVVDTINDALEANNLYNDAYAYTTSTGFVIKTRTAGEAQVIQVTAPAVADRPVLTAFLMPEYHVYQGHDYYAQKSLVIPPFGYPDPRGNIDQLTLEDDYTRLFFYLGSGLNLQEAYKNQALLRCGLVGDGSNDVTAIAPTDDGDSDATTPIIRFTGEDFTTEGAIITIVGTANIKTIDTELEGLTIILDDGSGAQTYTFRSVSAYTEIPTDLAAVFGAAVGGKLAFSISGTDPYYLNIATVGKGSDAYLRIVGGTALVTLGLTIGTHYADRRKNAGTPALAPYKPLAGDDLYINGSYVGRILEVAPGGTVTDLRINQEVPVVLPVGTTWTSYYIVARNLPGALGLVRPSPDMTVASDGTMSVKHSLLKYTTGAPLTSVQVIPYTYYKAIRLDVTPAATYPSLLKFDNSTDLRDLAEPVNSDNPMVLGAYLALLNSAGAQVAAIGVEAVTDDQPYGTTAAWESTFLFLESKEVYAIAPMTYDYEIAQLALTHITEMSLPENKGERICIFALRPPTRGIDVLVASGTNGNTDGATPKKFDTGIANISSLLLAQGIDPTGTIPVDDGVFLDIESDAKHYSVKSVANGVLTVRYQTSDFAAGENDDAFYATAELPQCIGETFVLKVRGAELLLSTGRPDLTAIAQAYSEYAQSFGSRRFWHCALDKARITLDGIQQLVEGFYYCAAYAGAVSGQPPQQSFTNFPIIGIDGVTGTKDTFGDRQLNRIAGGGNTIPIQDDDNGPVYARMALTTDMTSIETQSDNVTKALDYTAKFLRKTIRGYLGRFNITQNYIDSISHLLDGCRSFIVEEAKVLSDLKFTSIQQDTTLPDNLIVVGSTVPFYPCNRIRIRLIV